MDPQRQAHDQQRRQCRRRRAHVIQRAARLRSAAAGGRDPGCCSRPGPARGTRPAPRGHGLGPRQGERRVGVGVCVGEMHLGHCGSDAGKAVSGERVRRHEVRGFSLRFRSAVRQTGFDSGDPLGAGRSSAGRSHRRRGTRSASSGTTRTRTRGRHELAASLSGAWPCACCSALYSAAPPSAWPNDRQREQHDEREEQRVLVERRARSAAPHRPRARPDRPARLAGPRRRSSSPRATSTPRSPSGPGTR